MTHQGASRLSLHAISSMSKVAECWSSSARKGTLSSYSQKDADCKPAVYRSSSIWWSLLKDSSSVAVHGFSNARAPRPIQSNPRLGQGPPWPVVYQPWPRIGLWLESGPFVCHGLKERRISPKTSAQWIPHYLPVLFHFLDKDRWRQGELLHLGRRRACPLLVNGGRRAYAFAFCRSQEICPSLVRTLRAHHKWIRLEFPPMRRVLTAKMIAMASPPARPNFKKAMERNQLQKATPIFKKTAWKRGSTNQRLDPSNSIAQQEKSI